MSGSRKLGDWDGFGRTLGTLGDGIAGAARKAILSEAEMLRGHMVKGFTDQAPGGEAWKPLSPWTLAGRRLKGFRGTKALIRTGSLRNSITVVEDAKNRIWIGVPRTAISSNGKRLVDIAQIMEFGAGPFVVKLTPKMQRYLAILAKEMNKGAKGRGRRALPKRAGGGRGVGSGGATGAAARGYLIIRIPKRPFIAPVWKKYGQPDEMKKRILAKMQQFLKDARRR